MIRLFLSALLLLLPGVSEARQLDFKSEDFATYIRGSYGTCFLSDYAFANAGGSSAKPTTTSQQVTKASSGEFGLLFAGPRMNLRLSAEYLLPTPLSDVTGTYGGQKMFDLSSKVTALVTMGYLEYLFWRTSTSHLLLGGGGGLAFVKLTNDFTLTSTGKTTYTGMSSFSENAETQSPVIEAYAGYEVWFTDTVTAMFDAGYRYLPVQNIQSSGTAAAFTGSESKGAALKNINGADRTLNLGGVFAGLSFRFYL